MTTTEHRKLPIALALVAAMAFFMEALDSTIVVTALPSMARGLHTDTVSLSPGVTLYMLALAVIIPISGWIADRIGAKLAFFGGVVLFTLASAACGFAQTVPDFLWSRVFQGVGAALMSPVGRLALLRKTDKQDLVVMMNWVAFPGLLGPVLGPPLGGFIATFLDWRWIFLVNVPFGLIGAALVLKLVPGDRAAKDKPFDFRGFVFNGASLAFVIFGMDQLAHRGHEIAGAGLLALGGLSLFLAIRHARRWPHPLVGLEALGVASFRMATLTGGWLYRLSMTAPTFILPLFLQLGLGFSPAVSGALLLGHTGGDVFAKFFTARVIRLMGFRRTLLLNTVLFGALMAAAALFGAATPIPLILTILFASGVARSLVMTSITSLQFAEVPADLLTSASTLASAINPVVTAVGIAIASLALSVLAGQGAAPSVFTFRQVMIGTACLAFFSTALFYRLHPSAGAEARG